MDLEHVARLQELLANETVNRVTLDLKEVTFADRAAVQFLASAEAAGFESSTVRGMYAAGSPAEDREPAETD